MIASSAMNNAKSPNQVDESTLKQVYDRYLELL